MPVTLKNDQYSRSIILLWGFVDFCCITVGYYITNLFYLESKLYDKSLLVIIMLSWFSSSLLTKAYDLKFFKHTHYILYGLGKSLIIHVLLLSFSLGFIVQLHSIGINSIIFIHSIFLVLLFFLRILQLLLYKKIRNLKRFQTRYIIVGNTFGGRKLYHYLKSVNYPGLVFLGFIDECVESHLTVGKLRDIPDFCKKHEINQIFYALSPDSALYHQLIRFADDNYIHFGLIEADKLLPNSLIRSYTYEEYILAFPLQDAKTSQLL